MKYIDFNNVSLEMLQLTLVTKERIDFFTPSMITLMSKHNIGLIIYDYKNLGNFLDENKGMFVNASDVENIPNLTYQERVMNEYPREMCLIGVNPIYRGDGLDYMSQIFCLTEYIEMIFPEILLSSEWRHEIQELAISNGLISKLFIKGNLEKGSEIISKVKINQWLRPKFCEIAQFIFLIKLAAPLIELEFKSIWTNTLTGTGFIDLNYASAKIDINFRYPTYKYDRLDLFYCGLDWLIKMK